MSCFKDKSQLSYIKKSKTLYNNFQWETTKLM